MNKFLKQFLVLLLITFVIVSILNSIQNLSKQTKEISIIELIQEIQKENIKELTIKPTSITAILKNNEKVISQKESNTSFLEIIKTFNINPDKLKNIKIKFAENLSYSVLIFNLLSFIFPILLISFILFFLFKQIRTTNTKALMFGQSGIKKSEKTNVSFKDVAGCEEAKEELKEIIEFLKNPQKFIKMGARVPKGVLLVGPPGTGKTLLARAVANEANVPFFHISGSEFVEMFVGVGAARVRDAFNKAKKASPAILFIDEIDAIGRHRGAGLGGSHDEREQTLNQILVEMDGFEPTTSLIVIAATNRPDILDPALLRPGRFDRRITLYLPTISEREEILKVHSKNKPLSKEISLREIAERTPGFSGADLANLLNEAAILAARRNKKIIEKEDILESIEKVLLGPERKAKALSEEEKRITAYHEAGHAVISYILPHVDPVRKISIITRGFVGGYTLKLPKKEKYLKTRQEFLEEISVLLGGYVTEKKFFNDISTGAASDIKEATNLAFKMVTQFGMSEEIGPRLLIEKEELIFLGKEIKERRNYSEKTAEIIDEEVNNILKRCLKEAERIIEQNQEKIKKISQKLLEKETIEQEEFERLMKEE